MYKLVLLRHGESVWNKENKFTGWTDVGLTEKGEQEAIDAGKLFKKEGYVFDIAFTSYLIKATKTLDLCLQEMGIDIPESMDESINTCDPEFPNERKKKLSHQWTDYYKRQVGEGND